MFKYILLASITYLGVKMYQFVRQFRIMTGDKTKNKPTEEKDYSKLEIRDAEFKDLDE
tara:strand:+ start:2458 stop:2631 length:174 start_codon:yes stop_codon:yes gene_type:complete